MFNEGAGPNIFQVHAEFRDGEGVSAGDGGAGRGVENGI